MLGPSRTAEFVAVIRALEGQRADSLFSDPHAQRFLSPPFALSYRLGRPLRRALGVWPGLSTYIATRHRWFDDRLQAAIAAGVEHVVILGAGYDSRCLRFPGPTYWEVDHPSTARRKRRIAPHHPANRVDVDFSTQSLAERLSAAGFPRGCRAFVIWEGVTMYLTRDAIASTLHTLYDVLGPGSELVFDMMRYPEERDPEALSQRLGPLFMPFIGEPLRFWMRPVEVEAFLRQNRWATDEIADAPDLQRLVRRRRVYRWVFVVRAVRPG